MRHGKHPHPHRMGPPRGILRHITLLILKQQPKSGSELTDEIEQYADWRPSPGSIYPLLTRLQEDGLIESQPDQDINLRRFTLTEEGRRELEEHLRFDTQFKKRTRTIRKIYWRLHGKMPEDIYTSFTALIEQIEVIYRKAAANPERKRRFIDVLDSTTEQLKSLGGDADE